MGTIDSNGKGVAEDTCRVALIKQRTGAHMKLNMCSAYTYTRTRSLGKS